MARIGKKGAQGNGDLRSYFGFPKVVSNVVTKAGSMVNGYISPKMDRTRGMFALMQGRAFANFFSL